MTREFVPYAEALELKQLGFDEPCFGEYWECAGVVDLYFGRDCDELNEQYNYESLDDIKYICSAPLYQQAFRFFREKYGLYSWITMELSNKSTFCWVLSGEHTSTQYAAYFHTYEETELACLKKLIEIVKTKQ